MNTQKSKAYKFTIAMCIINTLLLGVNYISSREILTAIVFIIAIIGSFITIICYIIEIKNYKKNRLNP